MIKSGFINLRGELSAASLGALARAAIAIVVESSTGIDERTAYFDHADEQGLTRFKY